MSLHRRGKYDYGDSQADIRAALLRYSEEASHVAEHYADARCACGGGTFKLLMDELEGVALRVCERCERQEALCDSAEYLEDAEPEECECLCGHRFFEITVGISTAPSSEDTQWIFVGCRCPACSLTGCYGDWKSEGGPYQEMLRRV